MKTLLITLEYPPFKGGVANYYGQLVKFWPEQDGLAVLDNGRSRLINNAWPFLKWLPAFFALKREAKKQNIDHLLVGQILPLGTVALLAGCFFKLSYSVILHGLDFNLAISGGRKKFLARLILNNARKIICGNSFTAGSVKLFLKSDNDKVITINPGIEPMPAMSDESIIQLKKKYQLEEKLILLSVGRLVKRKGFNKVIAALPEILKSAPNLFYVILGRGEELENLQTAISINGLPRKVRIITDAPDAERDGWYAASDIFIMPSRVLGRDYEGFGIVYLEANLAGKPVIAGAGGGTADAVIDGLNGLIINSENASDIVKAVIRLVDDQNLREQLGLKGRARALKDFNWAKQAAKFYKSIYD